MTTFPIPHTLAIRSFEKRGPSVKREQARPRIRLVREITSRKAIFGTVPIVTRFAVQIGVVARV